MTDLLDTAIAKYGSLTPSEEHILYQTDKSAWIRYVARATARKIAAYGPDTINLAWPAMNGEMRSAVWHFMTPVERDLVLMVRSKRAGGVDAEGVPA